MGVYFEVVLFFIASQRRNPYTCVLFFASTTICGVQAFVNGPLCLVETSMDGNQNEDRFILFNDKVTIFQRLIYVCYKVGNAIVR